MSGNHQNIYFNGKIFTSNPDQPYASAMMVEGGRIVWVGDETDVISADGERIDLQGRRVLPGFIDAHMHPLMLADAAKQIACTPPAVHSIAELQAEIRKRRAAGPAEAWILCWGYDEGKLREGRSPTRWDLDEAASDVPVIATRSCGHIVVVNSCALKRIGIDKHTPNPPGGEIDKDGNGEPTGILRESAKDLAAMAMPARTLEDYASTLAELSPQLLAHGITAVTELMARKDPVPYFEMYTAARTRGFKQRTVLYYVWDELKKEPQFDEEEIPAANPIHVGGVKLFADGSVSGRTAWVDPPFIGGGAGISTTSAQELLDAAAFAERHRIQLVVHAMGERAIDLILQTFRGRKGWLLDAPSIRIEHASLPTASMIECAADMGVAFVMQPVFLYAEIESYLKNLGADRTKRSYPIQSFLQAGIKVAFSSDAPATAWADPANPFVGLKSAVTRVAYDGTDTGQEQRVDLPTAISLYTRAAQEITRIPGVGQLKPGYQADFIVLDRDIFEVRPEEIDQVRVEETYMGGSLVYRRK